MRRTERLFAIIQTLRSRRRPMTGAELASELAVSLRTLYRDMAELTAQRVPIRGEAGVGYVIDSDFDMPPLMLNVDELEAAVLGAAWVAQRGDAALHPLSFQPRHADDFDCAEVRAAIRSARKFALDYVDADGRPSQRIIWPILMGYMEDKRIIVGWCELRGDFRTFRADRIAAGQMLAAAIPQRSATLRKRWRERLSAECDAPAPLGTAMS